MISAKDSSGILKIVKKCYSEENKVLKNDASVPACIYKDYTKERRKFDLLPDAKSGHL